MRLSLITALGLGLSHSLRASDSPTLWVGKTYQQTLALELKVPSITKDVVELLGGKNKSEEVFFAAMDLVARYAPEKGPHLFCWRENAMFAFLRISFFFTTAQKELTKVSNLIVETIGEKNGGLHPLARASTIPVLEADRQNIPVGGDIFVAAYADNIFALPPRRANSEDWLRLAVSLAKEIYGGVQLVLESIENRENKLTNRREIERVSCVAAMNFIDRLLNSKEFPENGSEWAVLLEEKTRQQQLWDSWNKPKR